MKATPLTSATELTRSGIHPFQWITEYCRAMLLPILLAMVPTLYHYGNNVEKLTLVNLSRMLVINVSLAVLIYLPLTLFFRFQAIKAANATFVFLIFFNVYGLVYRYLLHLDLIRIEHYTLLPFLLMGSIYSMLMIAKPRHSVLVDIWKSLILVVSVLVLLNLVKIIPGEIEKGQIDRTSTPVDSLAGLAPAKDSPNPTVAQHSDMIYFTVDHIVDKQVASPKFVYVHLLLPHVPFVFSADGNIMDSDRYANWAYYIDNYKFSIKIAKEMIERILLEADSKNPPIIILQSDHGARNHLDHSDGSVRLPNYPEEFKTLILNALYIPGYNYSSLPQDIHPTNTFPIVFNYIFDTKIPLIK